MIVTRHQAGQIKAGRLTELKHGGYIDAGQLVAVHISHRRPAVCKIKIDDCWPHNDGGYVIMFHLAWQPEPPRLLHRRSERGYTTQPALAMPADPGEAVPAAFQDDLSRDAHQRDAERYAGSRGELEDRLRHLRRAHAQGFDIGRQVKRVEAAIEAAERRLRREAA